ncbi:MAG: hypothetical protein NZM25_10890 [Leptospiraceae bacterium]|nr:hypothetical protein [Leptospiraceae bacterium]MDW8305935.1 hypothetical protein [Leptospiraceae bacterium]
MHSKEIEHEFPFAWEHLVEVREMRYLKPELWQEVQSLEEKERTLQQGVLTVRRTIRLKNELPPMVRRYLDIEILEVDDLVICDYNKQELKALAYLETMGGRICFRQEGWYTPHGKDRSRRRISISAMADIPLAGEFIEKVFLFEFSRRCEKDRKLIIDLASGLSRQRLVQG